MNSNTTSKTEFTLNVLKGGSRRRLMIISSSLILLAISNSTTYAMYDAAALKEADLQTKALQKSANSNPMILLDPAQLEKNFPKAELWKIGTYLSPAPGLMAHAAMLNSPELIKYLINKGNVPNTTVNSTQNATDLALERESYDAANALLEGGQLPFELHIRDMPDPSKLNALSESSKIKVREALATKIKALQALLWNMGG